tara:strand:- start:1156 stop:1746 length:591 start_codon:yes stop_codon:yes gene_type:complete
MSLANTELELTDVTTISIPTDAILIISLLIVVTLLVYFFHNLLESQTNQFVEKVDDNSKLELIKEELEDHLILDSTTVNHDKIENQKIKKLNLLAPSKLLRIVSLAFVFIGGSSLLGRQTIHNSYKRINNTPVNIKTETQSAKSLLSIEKIKSSNKSQTKIKNISYIDPSLSTNLGSKNNNLYQVKEIQTADFFSF